MLLDKIFHAASAFAVLIAATTVTLANDVVIVNGRVIDPETRLDVIRRVAIEDGRIIAVSEFPLKGDTVIDAANHVGALGIIDLLKHGISIGDYRMQALQRVSTALEFPGGILPIAELYDAQASGVFNGDFWVVLGSGSQEAQLAVPGLCSRKSAADPQTLCAPGKSGVA